MWLDLAWTPREQNVLADKLTGDDHSDFDPQLRVASSYRDLRFRVLGELLDAGAELERCRALLRAGQRPRSPKRAKVDSLKIRDPWQ